MLKHGACDLSLSWDGDPDQLTSPLFNFTTSVLSDKRNTSFIGLVCWSPFPSSVLWTQIMSPTHYSNGDSPSFFLV